MRTDEKDAAILNKRLPVLPNMHFFSMHIFILVLNKKYHFSTKMNIIN